MLFNLLLNIGLLVLIATMLTNLPPVRALLLEEKQTFRSRLWLSLIFGMVSICSTYIGVPIQGAIVNTRVIGVMAAGLLGGPYVGVDCTSDYHPASALPFPACRSPDNPAEGHSGK